jgi:hypothetical protein
LSDCFPLIRTECGVGECGFSCATAQVGVLSVHCLTVHERIRCPLPVLDLLLSGRLAAGLLSRRRAGCLSEEPAGEKADQVADDCCCDGRSGDDGYRADARHTRRLPVVTSPPQRATFGAADSSLAVERGGEA